MKASELINLLQGEIDKNGDKEVWIKLEVYGFNNIREGTYFSSWDNIEVINTKDYIQIKGDV